MKTILRGLGTALLSWITTSNQLTINFVLCESLNAQVQRFHSERAEKTKTWWNLSITRIFLEKNNVTTSPLKFTLFLAMPAFPVQTWIFLSWTLQLHCNGWSELNKTRRSNDEIKNKMFTLVYQHQFLLCEWKEGITHTQKE